MIAPLCADARTAAKKPIMRVLRRWLRAPHAHEMLAEVIALTTFAIALILLVYAASTGPANGHACVPQPVINGLPCN